LVFEPLPLDTSSFRPLSAGAAIEYLKQAITFLENDWMIGPFPLNETILLNGLPVFAQPVFSVKRKDGGLERLIHNFSFEHACGISYNTLQLDSKVCMPTFHEICYSA